MEKEASDMEQGRWECEERVAKTAKEDDPCSPPSSKRLMVEKEATKTKATKKRKESKEDTSWICAECKEAECSLVLQKQQKSDSDNPVQTEASTSTAVATATPSINDDTSSDFLICDGSCHRIFHLPCAGLTKEPPTDDDWLCQDCLKGEHACAYCSEYGKVIFQLIVLTNDS